MTINEIYYDRDKKIPAVFEVDDEGYAILKPYVINLCYSCRQDVTEKDYYIYGNSKVKTTAYLNLTVYDKSEVIDNYGSGISTQGESNESNIISRNGGSVRLIGNATAKIYDAYVVNAHGNSKVEIFGKNPHNLVMAYKKSHVIAHDDVEVIACENSTVTMDNKDNLRDHRQ